VNAARINSPDGDAVTDARPASVTDVPASLISAWGHISRHLGLVVGGVTLTVVVLKVMAVARFDPAVAAALLSTADTAGVVVAVVLQLVPTFLLWSLVALVVAMVFVPGASNRLALGTLFWFTIFVTVLAVPLIELALMGGLTVILLMYIWYVRRGGAPWGIFVQLMEIPDAHPWLQWLVRGVLVLFLVIASIATSKPWLASEAITFEDGSVVTAYIVVEEQGRITLLEEISRRISKHSSGTIADRQVCRLGGDLQRPLWSLVTGPSTTPPCPS
jgi:hypothetical protein